MVNPISAGNAPQEVALRSSDKAHTAGRHGNHGQILQDEPLIAKLPPKKIQCEKRRQGPFKGLFNKTTLKGPIPSCCSSLSPLRSPFCESWHQPNQYQSPSSCSIVTCTGPTRCARTCQATHCICQCKEFKRIIHIQTLVQRMTLSSYQMSSQVVVNMQQCCPQHGEQWHKRTNICVYICSLH